MPGKARGKKEKDKQEEDKKGASSPSDDAVVEKASHVSQGDIDHTQGTDDDDSPVGVSWKESKEIFKQDEKKRKEAVDFLRSKNKEKRRKKNEMFVVQKRNKTSKRTYELTKLPEDIVQAIAKEHRVDGSDNPKEKSPPRNFEEKNQLLTKRKRKERKQVGLKNPEYYSVLVVKDEVIKRKKVQESAAAFLENHLYGNRLQRTSTTSNLTQQSKSSGVMRPAFKFSS